VLPQDIDRHGLVLECKMKPSRFLAAAGLFIGAALSAQAAPVWTDWQSINNGTLTQASHTTNVSLTGTAFDYDDGTPFYYMFPATFGNLAPVDMIREAGTGSVTLNFDQAVTGIYMALVSVGQPGVPVTYSFNNAFSVYSDGPGAWGAGTYSISGNDFTGNEFNGVLFFAGTFSSLTFNINQPEFWHGFNIAVNDVPEPGSLALLLGSLGMLGAVSRRRTAR
jgi:hypothetical protein